MRLERKTRRLVLRPLAAGDFAAWRESRRTTASPRNEWDEAARGDSRSTRADFRKLLTARKKMREADAHYSLGVFEKRSGRLIGGVSIMDVVRGLTHSAYLGYSIHNDFWGRGYGKESVRALIDIAFRDLKLHRVEAGIEPRNRRSIMMARSLGLRKEGLKKRMVFLRDAWRDLVIYSATCEDFGVRWISKTNRQRP